MTVIKMQSYASIKAQALTTEEVGFMLNVLRQRGMLRLVEGGPPGGMRHEFWTGSMDTGNPSHPRSTSVKVHVSIFYNTGSKGHLHLLPTQL